MRCTNKGRNGLAPSHRRQNENENENDKRQLNGVSLWIFIFIPRGWRSSWNCSHVTWPTEVAVLRTPADQNPKAGWAISSNRCINSPCTVTVSRVWITFSRMKMEMEPIRLISVILFWILVRIKIMTVGKARRGIRININLVKHGKSPATQIQSTILIDSLDSFSISS